jgi:outer membrane lipoprotein carrier protein
MIQRFAVLFLMVLVASTAATAQTASGKEVSDPEAKKLLDRVRKKYNAYTSLEAAFSLTIELPQSPKEVQRGTVAQQGDLFRLEMDDQLIVSDAKTTWVYLKKNKEIQVDDAVSGGQSEFLTPKELLRRYEKGDFIYAITDRIRENNKSVTLIEFKPVDKRSEFTKLRVAIDESGSTIESIRAFSRDGSRFSFQITSFAANKTFPVGHFKLDPKQYPGVRVEDLRM